VEIGYRELSQNRTATVKSQHSMHITIWILSALFALAAGVTDLRWRRIPNWLTYPAAPIAVGLHALAGGWPEAKLSIAGLALGLILLLPFGLLRSLGGGDWKLVGALGAFLGWRHLLNVLVITLLINALMAIVFIVAKKRIWRTLRNIGRLFAALFRLHLPGEDLTIDSPEAIKVPFGVAAAVGVLLYVAFHWQGPF
jgi:prepilin peptidase CpaA